MSRSKSANPNSRKGLMNTQKKTDRASGESAALFGWTPLCDATPPPKNLPFEVLHFGNPEGLGHIIQDGAWDDYGPIGIPESEGAHCKRRTITHWRLKER